jgi:exodeoxyribonuclease VII small subunit
LTVLSPSAILPFPEQNGSKAGFSAMSKPAKTDQPESFEAALAELEKIVASMESGKLTLEQSLAAHKRGLELAQYCQGVLARAQQQVKVLEENTLKNFPGADDE